MKTVGAYEAKTHLSELLGLVGKGEIITITKHGTTVAVLSPPSQSKKTQPKNAINEIKQYRSKHSLNGISLREMIAEGRR